MSLLRALMDDQFAADYARAGTRRDGGGPATRWSARALLFVLLLGIGLFAAVAVVQAREQPITNDQRERLITEVEERTAYTDGLRAQIQRLRQQIARMRGRELSKDASGREVRERLRQRELVTGMVPVEGPGLVVTLDDAAAGDGGLTMGSPPAHRRVTDRHLQALVNTLWEGGAEAIAIDGQRLTPLTAVRSAGEAILVNYRPVDPPYVVSAVGEPDRLRSVLAGSETGRRFHTLQMNVGIRFETEQTRHVRLPGASGLSLRHAREVGGE